jgi:hypothetical protein
VSPPTVDPGPAITTPEAQQFWIGDWLRFVAQSPPARDDAPAETLPVAKEKETLEFPLQNPASPPAREESPAVTATEAAVAFSGASSQYPASPPTFAP